MLHCVLVFTLFVFIPTSLNLHAGYALKIPHSNPRRVIDAPKHKIAVVEEQPVKEYFRNENQTLWRSNATSNISNSIDPLLPEDSPPLSEYPSGYPRPRGYPGGLRTNSLNHIPPAFPHPKNKNWSKTNPEPPPPPQNAVAEGSSSAAAVSPGAREDDALLPPNTGSQFSLFWPPIDAPKSRVLVSDKLPEVWPPIRIRATPSFQKELKLPESWESAIGNRLDSENEVVPKNKKRVYFPPVWPPITKYSNNDIMSAESEGLRPALVSEAQGDGKFPPVWPPIKKLETLRLGRSGAFPSVWPPITNLRARARKSTKGLRSSYGKFPPVWPPVPNHLHGKKARKIVAHFMQEANSNAADADFPFAWHPIPNGPKNDTGTSDR